jgi:hypothetical protein
VDAPLVRAYLDALPDVPPDERSVERVRTCLASLLGPDVRYLVATLLGPRAPDVARVGAAVLRAAGAPTSTLGQALSDVLIDGRPIDDALLAKAGTMSAASGYQLADTSPELGELTRREGTAILGLVAFAEASQRVALLLDPGLDASDPVRSVRPDLVVIGPGADTERALALVPAGTPVVVAPDAIGDEARVSALGAPALIGGRDYLLRESGGELEVVIRDETFVRVDPVDGVGRDELATGLAAALALGAMGIRMREDWVVAGLASLRAAPVAP